MVLPLTFTLCLPRGLHPWYSSFVCTMDTMRSCLSPKYHILVMLVLPYYTFTIRHEEPHTGKTSQGYAVSIFLKCVYYNHAFKHPYIALFLDYNSGFQQFDPLPPSQFLYPCVMLVLFKIISITKSQNWDCLRQLPDVRTHWSHLTWTVFSDSVDTTNCFSDFSSLSNF